MRRRSAPIAWEPNGEPIGRTILTPGGVLDPIHAHDLTPPDAVGQAGGDLRTVGRKPRGFESHPLRQSLTHETGSCGGHLQMSGSPPGDRSGQPTG